MGSQVASKKKSKKKNESKSNDKHRPRGARPFWSGTLSFGLVNVPVHLFPAHRSGKVRMRMLAPDGTPVVRRYYCPEHERDVHPEHLVRGFELDNGEYVIIHEDELEELEPKKTREIDLRRFVRLSEIPPIFFDRSYFLTPSGDSNKAYRLLAQVMDQASLAGIASFVMRDKEYLVAILAEGGILNAQILRMPDEIRLPEDVGLPEATEGDAKAVRNFVKLIKHEEQASLKGVELDDTYAAQIEALVERKLKTGDDVVRVESENGEAAEDETEDAPPHVDLLETIRRSLASADGNSHTTRHRGNGRHASEDGKALARLTKEELYQKAQQLEIEGRSGMTKDELVKAVHAAT